MIRRPPRSTLSSSSAASDVYKRQIHIVLTQNLDLLGIGLYPRQPRGEGILGDVPAIAIRQPLVVLIELRYFAELFNEPPVLVAPFLLRFIFDIEQTKAVAIENLLQL